MKTPIADSLGFVHDGDPAKSVGHEHTFDVDTTDREIIERTLLAMADGIVWGALGWWLTPVDRLDLAVVIIPMTVIVTCLGVLGMHVHMPSSIAFMLPITLPMMLAAVRATTGILNASPQDDGVTWPQILIVLDVVYLAASFLLFEYVIEE